MLSSAGVEFPEHVQEIWNKRLSSGQVVIILSGQPAGGTWVSSKNLFANNICASRCSCWSKRKEKNPSQVAAQRTVVVFRNVLLFIFCHDTCSKASMETQLRGHMTLTHDVTWQASLWLLVRTWSIFKWRLFTFLWHCDDFIFSFLSLVAAPGDFYTGTVCQKTASPCLMCAQSSHAFPYSRIQRPISEESSHVCWRQ